MARRESNMAQKYNQPSSSSNPRKKLEHLLNETYLKIDELKVLLHQEAELTGRHTTDEAVIQMFARQDYLNMLCAEACSAANGRNDSTQGGTSGLQVGAVGGQSCELRSPLTEREKKFNDKVEKECSKSDGSWYGSLDRSLAKKKKHQILSKSRRHTKTIGSMAGLDVIKKSSELKPDEQYEIGLPAAPRVTSTRSSIFPMTQHQYYTALMENKLTRKPAYPLDVRQPPPQYQTTVASSPRHTWTYPGESLDENKNMKKRAELPGIAQYSVIKPPSFIPPPCRSLGTELPFRQSSKSFKKWYETNLDEATNLPLTTKNPSPSPSMMSSTRGSSRGSVASGIDTVEGGIARMAISSPGNESIEFTSKSSESSESWSGAGNEVTKPFEMSDYYKYSTKFRSKTSPVAGERNFYENTVVSGQKLAHSRQPSQICHSAIDARSDYEDQNGNPTAGPKLPPKSKRTPNKSVSSIGLEGGEGANDDASKDIWITDEPTFV